ncbi:MAG TPA: hypothetical protein PKW23_02010 [Dictyoglomaceae bacterium]|nr:hypothetical protein [Dictyoglomaceae bacterium]HOL39012.1 hypothetical protein [Dictyoglomaceae bacterium]HOP94351.1 hypothetical protein [Dictyoglomaceae bacterium]HPP15812.1 hypothetical protein [Dictyoglomaceae bacterium]HPU42801.1 hypothetical protein [Dictyoglomaceae bacterium]
MKKVFIAILLILLFSTQILWAQTQTQTVQNEKKPATIFILHILTFNDIVKSNLEKDVQTLDESFKMNAPIYHPAIGLNLSFYTKLHQKGLPYPSMVNRILKNLVPALNSTSLPDNTQVNIILYVDDAANIYEAKTLFLTFPISVIKEYIKNKDLNKLGTQIISFIETDKLQYKNGVFTSSKYDFEWILKI